ncbi:MAG: dipeptide epimerase [Candidatus Omnitrophota bacterium]|nr:dipeptide epimerase [Candidatus Omnitrophota bacterium]
MKEKSGIIKKTSVKILRRPLNQPFRTATGEHKSLENVLFSLELADGVRGWGEAAVATHITGETVEKTQLNLKNIGPLLRGQNVSDYLRLSTKLREVLAGNPAALAAVEIALVDALTRQKKIPLWKFFGKKCALLKTDITIVIGSLVETQAAVEQFFKQGFRTFKIKIGRDFDLDYKRILAVHRLSHGSDIYLDINQGYSAEETLSLLKELGVDGIRPALLEQPVPRQDWEGLKKISRSTDIPVCADESVRHVGDAALAIREKAVSVINIKLMKFGLFEALEIIALAQSNNVGLMIGGMMESSLAMTAAAHMAAGMRCFQYIDLDTPFFLKHDIVRNRYLSKNGVYDLRDVKAGIGLRL